MTKRKIRFICFLVVFAAVAIVLLVSIVISCIITKYCYDNILWMQVLNIINGILAGCLTSLVALVINRCSQEIRTRKQIQTLITDLADNLEFNVRVSKVKLLSKDFNYLGTVYRNLNYEIGKLHHQKDALRLSDLISKLLQFQCTTYTVQDVRDILDEISEISDNLVD